MPGETEKCLSEVVIDVVNIIKTTPQARKFSSAKSRQLAIDISLIALGVRTAYLVDAVVVADPIDFFQSLIKQLRRNFSAFEDLFVWYEPSSAQSFVVNAGLYRNTSREMKKNKNDPWPLFVSLRDSPAILLHTPMGVLQVLEDIDADMVNHVNTTSTTSLILNQETMIPLAAVLLEYPVAYVPSSPDQTVFLSGETLDVYECLLIHSPNETSLPPITLLKFSCPAAICLETEALSSQKLVEMMEERFSPRIKKVDHHLTLEIRVSAEKFDRVAL